MSIADLSGRLRALKEEKGLSQAQLAKMAGVSQPTVFQWFNGSVPQPHRLAALAAALGVEDEWLATGQGEKERGAAPSKVFLERAVAEDLARLLDETAGELGRRAESLRVEIAKADRKQPKKRL